MNVKTKWDLSHIIPDVSETGIEKSFKTHRQATDKFIKKWKNRSDYLEDPEALREALDDYDKWLTDFGSEPDAHYYFWLAAQANQSDPKIKAAYAKTHDFTVQIGNSMLFFEHRISKIKKQNQKKFLADPKLAKYKNFLKKSFKSAEYLLSEEEEKILSLKSKSSYGNWVKMTQEFISREEAEVLTETNKEKKLPFSQISSLLNSTNAKARNRAATAFNQIMEKHADTAEHELNSILYDKKVNDDLRKITRPDLLRHLSDDIKSEIVDTLVESVSNHNRIAQSYYKLKASLFKVKRLKYHERNVPYGNVSQKYTLDEALNLVGDVFENLDPEFKKIFLNFFSNDQVDVYPKKSKSSGAFCAYGRISHPVYILLNFDGQLHEITTIAHEFGHAINNELTKKSQNAINFGSPLSIAEVASTFMEDFVLQAVLKSADDKTKLIILMQKLNEDISTIFRQIACYKFELELHREFRKRGYLTKQDIGKIFQKHMASYMGPAVEQSKGAENWWVYWSHIRNYFYVYSYANGLLISKALQAKVKKDPAFIGKVKQVLSGGLSAPPYEIFKKIGIDISKKEFWLTGIKETEALLKETEKLAKKLKLIA